MSERRCCHCHELLVRRRKERRAAWEARRSCNRRCAHLARIADGRAPRKGKYSAPVGEKFGFWTVIESGRRAHSSLTTWLCRCRCGVERVVMMNHVRRGRSKGCGRCFNWRGVYVSSVLLAELADSTGMSPMRLRCRMEARQ